MNGIPFLKLQRTDTTVQLMGDMKAMHLLTVIAYRARFTDEPDLLNNLKFGEAMVGDYDNYGMTRKEYRAALSRLAKYCLIAFSGTGKGTIARLLDSRVFSLRDERKPENSGHQQGQHRGHQQGQQVSEVKPSGGATERATPKASKEANEGPPKGQRGATNQNVQNDQKAQNAPQNAPQQVPQHVEEKIEKRETIGPSGPGARRSVPMEIAEVYEFADSKEIPRDTVDAWWTQSSKSGFTVNGKPMFDWQQAFFAWAQADAMRKRPEPDRITGSDFWNWIRSEGHSQDAAEEFVRYNRRHGWKRRNHQTGRDEPIFDAKRAFLAFYAYHDDGQKARMD